jgi:tetratricopeptide (TPR) repeat protein
LAETLGGWLELAQALDRRLGAPEAPEDLAGLRRLALIYEDKCGLPARAELKLRQILLGDSQDDFALARLSGILEKQPQRNTELKETLEQMALSSSQERRLEALEALVRLGRQTGDGEGLRSALQRLSEMEPERGELLTELESLLGGLGDWSALADLLERLASMGSQEDQRKRRLRLAGVLKEKLGRPDRAAAILEDLIADQPQDFAAVGALVGLLGDEGNWRRAAELLLASVSQDNLEESLAHLDQALGLALEKVGDRGLGRRILERALELHPGHLENLLKLVDLREAEEDFEGAAALWDQVAQATEEPEARAQALHMGTRLLARTSVDPAELLARVGQTLALKPDHFDARRLALEVLERQGRWNEAFDAWMALAAEDQANRGTALAGAARIKLQELGDAKGALEILESRGARAATTLELRGLLLDALEKAGRHQDLIDRLAEELVGTTDQSRRSDLCRRTAVAYRDGLGQVDKFLSWIEEAHKAEENPAIVEELLTHYRGVGDGKRVLGLLQWKVDHLVSRRKMKEVPGLLLEVAAIHESLGDPDRALEDLRRAEGVDASNLTVLMNLARLLTNLGEQDELLRILQILVVRIGELPDEEQRIFVYLALARATLASGQKSKAKQYLSRLLAIRKYHQEALDLLETIQKS